ncbi:ankyrin repeat domain-containing protein [Candidatus Dependentiae bacterium]|nr:ankyrin repeat domain-containing protein [Candidatus Dependentiae bacterium]
MKSGLLLALALTSSGCVAMYEEMLLPLVSDTLIVIDQGARLAEQSQKLRNKIEEKLKDMHVDLNAKLDSCHDQPLLECASKCELNDLLELLLKRDANPNIVHLIFDYTPLHKTCSTPNPEGALLLLQHGAKVDHRSTSINSCYDMTPLALAAKNGYSSMVELFLKHEANPNSSSTNDGLTPLMYALEAAKTKPEVSKDSIKMLLFYGADPFKVNKLGYSAIDLAKKQNMPDLVKLLENAGKNLRLMLTKLLSRGGTPFNTNIASIIAHHCYTYTTPDVI